MPPPSYTNLGASVIMTVRRPSAAPPHVYLQRVGAGKWASQTDIVPYYGNTIALSLLSQILPVTTKDALNKCRILHMALSIAAALGC